MGNASRRFINFYPNEKDVAITYTIAQELLSKSKDRLLGNPARIFPSFRQYTYQFKSFYCITPVVLKLPFFNPPFKFVL